MALRGDSSTPGGGPFPYRIVRALSSRVPLESLTRLELALRYRKYLREFGSSDSDIWVASYSKSGTTWMQMILYQLTTDGSMDFHHLFEVSPWVYYSALREVSPAVTPAPRILKSHDSPKLLAAYAGGRFLYMLRDGKDVAVSWYHHRRNYRGYRGEFDEHFTEFLYGREYNWFWHVRQWLENRPGLPVLYIKFEDLLMDFDAEVNRVTEFCGLGADPRVRDRTRSRCHFSYMKQHDVQLGPRRDHFRDHPDGPYHINVEGQFIRNGVSGEGLRVLSATQVDEYRARFDEILGGFDLVEDYR